MTNGKEITRTMIHEHLVSGMRLGRHVAHDPRSRDFQASRAKSISSVQHKSSGLPLNQGEIGSCTANALCGALDSAPDAVSNRKYTEKDAVRLVKFEQELRGMPFYVLPIELAFLFNGAQQFNQLIGTFIREWNRKEANH